jgi:phosphonoacetaldehyde hydrolase
MLRSLTQINFAPFSTKLLRNPLGITNKYRYDGPIKCAILDWSGTLSDAGVLAPAVVFVDVFKKFGIKITMEEARIPMGLRKDLHIGALLKMSTVREQWKKLFGEYPNKDDTDDTTTEIFKKFIPMQLACLNMYGEIIPGADIMTQQLRNSGVKLGLTTGFTKEMSDVLRIEAEKQGVILDTTVAGDEVECGARPYPSMLYKNLDRLGIERIQSVVKVDDTVSGIGEAINAGCWSVGVCRWSNYTNYDSLTHLKSASEIEVSRRSLKAREILNKSGAHYVIEDINELQEVIDDINNKLRRGIQPTDIDIN